MWCIPGALFCTTGVWLVQLPDLFYFIWICMKLNAYSYLILLQMNAESWHSVDLLKKVLDDGNAVWVVFNTSSHSETLWPPQFTCLCWKHDAEWVNVWIPAEHTATWQQDLPQAVTTHFTFPGSWPLSICTSHIQYVNHSTSANVLRKEKTNWRLRNYWSY